MRQIFQGRRRGIQAERRAQKHLEHQGLTTLCRNYQCRGGEIDLIMEHDAALVFVEVRYRRQTGYGSAAESVTESKQAKLIRAANHYLSKNRLHNRACRFDVVAIDGEDSIEWIRDAFQQEIR